MSRAFVFLNCDIGAERTVIEELRDIKGISKTMGLSGIYDIVAEPDADSEKGISKLVRRLRSIANIRACFTMIVAEKYASANGQEK
jgi:hypothetical protein